jgi:hypothetical protein
MSEAAVSGVLARAAEFFLVSEVAEPREAVTPPSAVRAVVLGSPQDAIPLAAAVALMLRAAERVPAAVVAAWAAGRVEEPRASAATRSTARLARRLTAHGLVAVARGRLTSVALPPDPGDAAAAVRRASRLVEGPLVTALAGARPEELESLVAEHDLAVVAADPDTALARAALASLAGRGVTASACRPLRRGLGRSLALAGLAAPRLDLHGRWEEA